MGLFFTDLLTPRVLLILLIIGTVLSYLSRRYQLLGVWWCLTNFDRPEYLASFPGKGAWFFVLGFLLSAALFQKEVALAAMSILVIGDPLSHLIGSHFGSIKHPFSDKKFIEGHIAGAFVSSYIASYFVPWGIALCGAVAGMFMEGVDIVIHTDPVDDNVVIPLAAGIVITLLLWI